MGIEAGPSGAVSVAGIVNEGPVRGSLEGFRPMNIKPLGEIVFNQSPLTTEGVISQAEAIISEARNANSNTDAINPDMSAPRLNGYLELLPPVSVIPNEVRNLPTELNIPNRKIATSLVSLAPRNDGLVLDDKLIQPEARRLTRQVVSPSAGVQPATVYAPAVQEQLVEEVVRAEQLRVGEKPEQPSETREEEPFDDAQGEDVEELKIKYVEDEAVSGRRKYEIREAINKAKIEAEEEGVEGIEGWRVEKYLVPEHAGIRSGIAEPGIADGSLVETYQDISAKNYDSLEQANQVADSVIADKKPVKKAKEGKKVKERDVARIRRDPFLKRHPVEEVVARVVKKSKIETKPGQKPVEVTSAVVTEEFAEPTIKDLGLADIFPKAA